MYEGGNIRARFADYIQVTAVRQNRIGKRTGDHHEQEITMNRRSP
jgi:hypothetical protein